MCFEVKEKDVLARIGRLKTKSGTVETPLLFPVINPAIQPIPARKIKEEFGFDALLTNAYILKKRFQNQPAQKGLHQFLDFNGVIMTDSGAYQILVYGDIDTNQKEIVAYQEQIGSDIATILDIPTSWKVTETHAEQTVKETLKRAKEFFKQKTREDILWVGPIQGGKYLNLVAKSAREMGKLPFQIHALGSPTEVMERYRFDVLVDMILTAKMNLPVDRPLHLFGAGHPFMLALAVALGCDLFDSAAYAIYARQDRYMTETGTWRLNELDYFPCSCSKCTKATPKEVLAMPQEVRHVLLAEHNLYVCMAEINRIKQAIKDGRLWEHMEQRAHNHPALLQALKKLENYQNFIEKNAPTAKKSGIFIFDSVGLFRPEVVQYRKRLAERYSKPEKAKILLLLPQTRTKPFHKTNEYTNTANFLQKLLKKSWERIHVCFYVAPFGIVPIELDEVYPLSQHETALPLDKETIEYVVNQIVQYIERTNYKAVVLLHKPEDWNNTILKACKKTCQKRKIHFNHVKTEEEKQKTILSRLGKILQETLREQP